MYNNKNFNKMKTLVFVIKKENGQRICKIYDGLLNEEKIDRHVFHKLGEELINWEYADYIEY